MTNVTLSRGKAVLIAVIAIAVCAVASCSSREGDDFEVRETESVYAFRSASAHADVLKKCVLINTVAASCALNELPVIGDGVTTPTVDQIMDRVLVTHDWMGVRLEEILRDSPESLLTLFSSTTAILIGSKVRPSFYTRLNGAIQLDPVYLWTTLDEKRSISIEEDFRSGFGEDLQYWFLSRLAKPDGSRLELFYSLEDDSVRPIEDVKLPLQRLLFHELVHATDFMPRNKIAGLDTSLSIYNSIDSIRSEWLSNTLQATHPLNSDNLRAFADVRFGGEQATTSQMATNSIGMGALMEVDGAIEFYSYSSQFEDLAQLVEGVMMGHHYDALTNIGFTQKPLDEDNYSCNDLLVGWGQRNRLADPLVSVRARAATELVANLTPELIDFMDNSFGSAEQMTNNVHWCDNQAIATVSASDIQARSYAPNKAPMSASQFREMMRTERVVHPDGFQHD